MHTYYEYLILSLKLGVMIPVKEHVSYKCYLVQILIL
jgi:hypothetical protein